MGDDEAVSHGMEAERDDAADWVPARFTLSYLEMARAIGAINRTMTVANVLRRASWVAIALIALLVAMRIVALVSVAGILFLPVLLLIIGWSMPLYMAWITRRGSPHWAEEQVIEFSADGIRSAGAGAANVIDWPAVMRTVETSRFFLFFTAPRVAHFVPKRVLTTDEVTQLRRLFAERAGKTSTGVASWHTGRAAPLVEVSFTLDADEIARAATIIARRGGTLWIPYIAIFAIVLWTTVPPIYTAWQRGGLPAIDLRLAFLGVVPLLIIAAAVPLSTRLSIRRMMRSAPSVRVCIA